MSFDLVSIEPSLINTSNDIVLYTSLTHSNSSYRWGVVWQCRMEGSNEVEIVREQRLDEDHQETQTTSLLLAPSTSDIFVDPKKFVDTKSESIVSTEIVQKIENERTYENDQISRESESEEISLPLNDESLGNREDIQFDDILEMESGDRLPDIIPDQTVVATVTLETTTSEQEMHQIPSPQLSPTDHRTLHFPRTATRGTPPPSSSLLSCCSFLTHL
jgi:hypothetical protein